MSFIKNRNTQALNNFHTEELRSAAMNWHNVSRKFNYQYMFESFGLPIIQDPQDIVMLQELIWTYRPDFIVETGVARGGSIALSAALLAIQNFIDGVSKEDVDRRGVIGIDIEIREENLIAIKNHPLESLITLIEGSSTDNDIFDVVVNKIPKNSKTMVILDSNHTHKHVYQELNLYSRIVTCGMPLVVMDTGIEFAEIKTLNVSRGWSKGNNPYSAVQHFLSEKQGENFSLFREFEYRHLITCAPEGILIRNCS